MLKTYKAPRLIKRLVHRFSIAMYRLFLYIEENEPEVAMSIVKCFLVLVALVLLTQIAFRLGG